ncbi:MAG TPA: PAS domain S-box protein [Prolixibacteraceae bacterium]|nr:PAS domain S-box protein [Prolixibacteraceae bacterium]
MVRNKYLYLIIALLLIIGVFFFANYYRNSLQEKSVKSVHNELISIASLKIKNIADWYIDELVDAQFIAHNKLLINGIINFKKQQLPSDSMSLNSFLATVLLEHGYKEILIFNSNQTLLYSTQAYNIVPDQISKGIKKALVTHDVFTTDLYIDKTNDSIYIDFISPVIHEIAEFNFIVVFRMDPNRFLFPLIQNWPLPSETAETAIFRKDLDSIIYLNELRHEKNSALKLSIPVSRTDISAIKALSGKWGIVEGLDYRGVEVVSYVSEIPGTPWYIIAEVDKLELYDGINNQTRVFNVFLVLFLLLVLTLVAFGYSNSQKNIFKKLWLAHEKFKTTLYSIGDGVITTDSHSKITYLNQVAETLTGWTEKDAIGLDIEKVFHIISEENLQKVESLVKKVIEQGEIVGLANHTLLISKDGNHIPIADSGAPIFDKDGTITGVVLVFRDQTKEREHNQIIEEQRRRLFTLMSNLPGMAYRCKNDEWWTMEFVSKGCFDLLGYSDYEIEGNKKVTYGELIVPDDRDLVHRKVTEALEKRSYFEMEYRIIDRSGKERWVWERGQGVLSGKGEVIAVEGFISDITQQKLTITALRQSEKLFQTLTNNAGVGIFKTNQNGLTVYVNPKYCELSGSTYDDALGLGWLKNIHPDDKDLLIDNWQKAFDDKAEHVEQYRFLHPNNKEVWVSGQVSPEFDHNQKIIGYVGYIADVTERKASEEEIKQKKLLIDTVIENIPDAVYMKDIEGRKLVANNADIINCGGKTVEDVLGKNDFDLFPPDIAEQFWQNDLRVLRDGEVILNRLEKLSTVNGQTRWLNTSKIPLKDENGKIIGLVGIGHDITRRMKDEEERIKLSTVVAQTPLSIMITDPQGNIEYVNHTFTKVTGYSEKDVIGKNPRFLKSGTYNAEFYEEMWNTLLSKKVWSSEFQNKKKNGEIYWEYVFITPILNSNGELINYAAVREDITEKRKLLDDLMAAKEKAEESDKLKTSFLANMSHEIRTPLNSILGFTSILEESEDISKDDRSLYSSIIRKSSDGLLQIINDIIDISSLETGQLKINISTFDVNRMLDIIMREFTLRKTDMGKNKVEFRKLGTPQELILNSDQNRLNQIFNNLLNNALKFTESGYIEFGILKVTKEFIYFKVEDSGIGIPADMYDLIFERFRQGDNEDTRFFGGNGLGLSIVKNLIELMGGSISVNSEEGKGTVFNFNLPHSIYKR